MQRWLAVIVIIAMLAVMGIPVSIIVFFAIVTSLVWRAFQTSEQQETRCIFEFYVAANDILRDEERRWYGFEINEVIENGEHVLHIMSDPPPLVFFTLGVLYHHTGEYELAIEHLSYIIENDLSDERHRDAPSRELRHYVQVLRKLESEPTQAPQTIGAIRSLERTRRKFGAELLDASRRRVNIIPTLSWAARAHLPTESRSPDGSRVSDAIGGRSNRDLAPRRPIADVLRDVYEEEKKSA